jgi:hypothetical protein
LSFVGWVDGSWVEGEAGVGQEPDHQIVALADSLDALFGGVGDLGQGGRGPIRQLDILEVGPEVFDRVQLGGVGGEPLVLLRELGDFSLPSSRPALRAAPPAAVLGRQHHSRGSSQA